jgi:hypothetical protein
MGNAVAVGSGGCLEMNVYKPLMIFNVDHASKVVHYALNYDTTLREAALKLGFIDADEFDRILDPARMAHRHRPGGSWSTPSSSVV